MKKQLPMEIDKKIDVLLKEFSKRKFIDIDFIYSLKGVNYDYPDIDFIIKQMLENSLITTTDKYIFHIHTTGVEIIEKFGGWIAYKQHKNIRENTSAKKEKLDLKLASWQAKTFWWFFIFAIIGGLCGVISIIMQIFN